jgi:hypothetical protein
LREDRKTSWKPIKNREKKLIDHVLIQKRIIFGANEFILTRGVSLRYFQTFILPKKI